MIDRDLYSLSNRITPSSRAKVEGSRCEIVKLFPRDPSTALDRPARANRWIKQQSFQCGRTSMPKQGGCAANFS